MAAACGGTDPSASGVFPAEGFAGRDLRVEISGDATSWTDGATVTFGAGVTVSNVTVASPTDLFADLKIDASAAAGLQDVTVASNGSVTLKQAFSVTSPVEAQFTGGVEQGGRPLFTIINHDFDNPFDLTADASGALANLTVTGPAGTDFQVDTQSSTAYALQGVVFIDGNAAAGMLTVASGPTASQTSSVIANVDIKARAATPLTSGTQAMGTIANVGDTLWYSLAAPAGLVHLGLGVSSSTASPAIGILEGGSYNHIVGGTYAVVPAETVNIVVLDTKGVAGYNVNLLPVAEALASVAEPAAPADDTTQSAVVPAAIPFQVTNATISGAADLDYTKLVIDAAHASKKIHIVAQSADNSTDTAVDVTTNATTSAIGGEYDGGAQGGSDGGFTCQFTGACGEDIVVGPLAAGTYYVKVEAGALGYDASFTDYSLLVWFE
ncbi:MAG: hypothetical protein ABI467_14510 [Kofleriaceae bacterium]